MHYMGGNLCDEKNDIHFSLRVQINCNKHVERTVYQLDTDSLKNPCEPLVVMNSEHGCPVWTTGTLAMFMDEYSIWLGVPLIIMGLYLMSAGGRYPKSTLFCFTTFMTTIMFTETLYINLMPSYTPLWTVWVSLIVTTGMGVGLGFGAAWWPRIGVGFIGLCFGGLLGKSLDLLITKLMKGE